jgi:hexosaminidase
VQVTDSGSPAQTATVGLSITVGGCTTTITGTHNGPLVAHSGVICLNHATVTGPVSISGGAVLSAVASHVSGPLSASGVGSLAACGTTISGPVAVTGASGPVLLGGGSGSPCAADATGPVSLSGNTGGVILAGATVSGPVSLSGNSGGTVVSASTISGPLSCSGNTPPPTDNGHPNTTGGPATGQCSTLA